MNTTINAGRFNPMAFQRAEIASAPQTLAASAQNDAAASDARIAAAVAAAVAIGFKPSPVDRLMVPNRGGYSGYEFNWENTPSL